MDVLISLEIIEHIEEDILAIKEIHRVLNLNGKLLLTTPNALITKPVDDASRNLYYIREYSPPQIAELLERYFSDVTLLGQRVRGTIEQKI